MAKLKDYSKVSVQTFLDELGAPTASPGGGSAAAIVAATACALLEMVAGINDRRRKTEDGKQKKRLGKIRKRLLELMTEDVKTFEALREALKKKLSVQKRDLVYLRAASAPLEVCKHSVEIAAACGREKKKTSLWLMSDWREVKILALAAFYSAWLNVEVNLNEIKNKKLANRLRKTLKKWHSQMDAHAQN